MTPEQPVAEPAWVRVAPLGLAAVAAVLYLWNLEVSGYANTYYSAAAQAASQSLSAWFFGSLDAAGFISVDKPPASLWLMGLSVRLFGLSPAAVLLPQALAGVAAVVLLSLAVKRQLGPGAGLIAGLAFAVTPVAALMFRYNNPDALLVLLLVGAAYALVRGLEAGRMRWAVLAAVLVGFAFLTKYLQAYLVLPAFALTWFVAAPGSVARRIGGLLAAAVTVAVSSLWWVALMELLPASSRPYVGGSTTNSAVELLLGYDGLGRIFGAGGGAGPGGPVALPGGGVGPGAGALPGGGAPPGGGGGPGAGFGGSPGLLRMLNDAWGTEVSWLVPGAAIGLAVGLLARLRAPRTDPRRAAYLLWGTWALVHVLVFSLMTGIAHPYYAVALAPALAALFGGGVMELWRLRSRTGWAGAGVGATLVVTAWWSRQLLERTPDFAPGLGSGALVVAIGAAVVIAVATASRGTRARPLATGALAVGVAAVLVGPLVYTAETMTRAIAGGDPHAGPDPGGVGGVGAGFPGGSPGDDSADAALVAYLLANRGDATWLAAVSSANQAGPLQLATGAPVMAMGGFMGSDPAPTLEQLRAYVRDGRLRFVLLGARGGGPGGFFGGDGVGSVASERSTWVQEACTPVPIDGTDTTVYDCAGAAG